MTWKPSEETLSFTRKVFKDLGEPDFTGIRAPAIATTGDPWLDLYSEAVSGLGAFMREARFHIALAGLYMVDVSARGPDQLEQQPDNDATELRDVGLPPSVMAWIMTVSPAPTPEDVLFNPHQHAVGGTTAGKWWASSLLDSAILRLVFSVDRVAAALWAYHSHITFRPAPTIDTRWPRFLEDQLSRWADVYSPAGPDTWTKLVDLSRSDLWAVLQEWRHGLVHRTRPVSELQFPAMIQHPIRTVSANASEDFHWGIAGGGYWWTRDLIGQVSGLLVATVETQSPPEEE